MLSPTLSAPPPHSSAEANPTANDSNTSPNTRRRGFSYLRVLSSRDHNANTNSPATADSQFLPVRPSPRHFFTRSTSYQDTKNNRNTEGRRRSQSHSRPHQPAASSVSLVRVASERGGDSTQHPETAGPAATARTSALIDPALAPTITTTEDSSNLEQAQDPGGQLDATSMARSASGNAVNGDTESKNGLPTIRFFPHQDHNRMGRQSLNFSPISRTLPHERSIIRVGRYSEREGPPISNPVGPSEAPVGFKSKVVSRKHCEFCFVDGQWQIRDVSSSSGTFLNHIRLSQPNQESKLYPIKDGDIVQLGIDFRGGEEMIFRCVKIRIECNRSWQKKPNQFNKSRRAQLLGLSKDQPANSNSGECSICLGNVLPCQALFVAPCAHVWHYKCIRPMLERGNSSFQCPNCRAYSDLDADVDIDMEGWAEEEAENQDKDLKSGSAAISDNKDHTDSADHDTPQASPRRSEESYTGNGAGAPDDDGPRVNPSHSHTAVSQPTLGSSGLLARRNDRPVAPASGTENISPPMNSIPIPRRPTEAEMHDMLSQQRTQTETPSGELIIAGEGPLTPRNNAGPFVFDGSGSRTGTGSRRRLAVPEARSLNQLRDVPN